MVNRTPQVVGFTIDPYEYLVQVPAPVRVRMMINPTPSDLGGKQRTEPVSPKPNRLVTDVDATFGQQVLDLPQRKRKPDIHHHREPNYLGRTVEISEGVFHPLRLGNSPYWLKPIYSDNAT